MATKTLEKKLVCVEKSGDIWIVNAFLAAE